MAYWTSQDLIDAAEKLQDFTVPDLDSVAWENDLGWTKTWWEDVNPNFLVEDDYTPQVYKPGFQVESMHNLFAAFRPETFDPDDKDYLTGVAVGASIFLILGVLVCIGFPITLCCMARFKSCCKTLRNENPKSSCIRWWVIATYIGGIFGVVFSFLGFIRVNNAIQSVSDKVDNIGDLLAVGVNVARISVNLLSETGAYLKEATASLLDCLGPDSPQLPAVTLATDKLEDAMAVAQENFRELVDQAMQDTADKAYDISDTVNDTEFYRTLVTGLIFGMDCFIFAILAISGIVLLFKRDDTMRWLIKASRCSTIISAPMGMLLIVGSWLITAGAVAIAMLSGDYCINPEQSTYTLADGPYVSYYLTCEGPNPALEAITRILNGIQDSSSSLAEVIQANAETGGGILAGSQCLASGENLDAFSRAYYGLYKLAETAGAYLSCRTINTLFSRTTQEVVCSDLENGLRQLWAGSIILAVCLMFLMLVWRILLYQAENAMDRASEQEKMLQHPSSSKFDGGIYAPSSTAVVVPSAESATLSPQISPLRNNPSFQK